MAEHADQLIRFLLPRAQCRGAIIRASGIVREAAALHGLNGPVVTLFGQGLVASILLLSISKGGIRQVLQLDGDDGPVSRLLAEAGNRSVRGYMQWATEPTLQPRADGLLAWLGRHIRLSTVRDLGFGQPYVSVIETDSPYLADAIVQYLSQSVQIRADVILHDDLGLIIEAMPGCDEAHWFQAVECMAAISDEALNSEPATVLDAFAPLDCKVLGGDCYAYRCRCNPKSMAEVLRTMPAGQLADMRDAQGEISVSCRYCNKTYRIAPPA